MLITESTQLKSKISNLLTEIMVLTESNQTLNKEVQNIKDERDNEIKLLNEHADQIRSHNSNLITENDTLNSEKLSLQQQLEESRKQIQSYQQQVEQLKADKMRLNKSNRSLKQQLTESEKEKNKFSKVAHLSSKSAQRANTAVALFCKPCTPQQRFSRTRSLSFSEGWYTFTISCLHVCMHVYVYVCMYVCTVDPNSLGQIFFRLVYLFRLVKHHNYSAVSIL